MSFRSAYHGRHAAPARVSPARVAGTAAALALGAVPFAAASAQADSLSPSEAAAKVVAPVMQQFPGVDEAVDRAAGAALNARPDGLADKATGIVEDRVNSSLPTAGVAPQLLSQDEFGQPQVAAGAFQYGPLGTVTRDAGPAAQKVTGAAVTGTRPVISRLRSAGVPTVSDATGQLGSMRLPVGGSVGNVTDALPVSSTLDSSAPLADAFADASEL